MPGQDILRPYTTLSQLRLLAKNMALHLQKQVTNYFAAIVSLVLAIVGLIVIYIGAKLDNPFWSGIVKEIGSVLLGIGILALLWEVFTKRNFREETLTLVGIATELSKAGIEKFVLNYMELGWPEMLRNA